jgi:hypothetical protein
MMSWLFSNFDAHLLPRKGLVVQWTPIPIAIGTIGVRVSKAPAIDNEKQEDR